MVFNHEESEIHPNLTRSNLSNNDDGRSSDSDPASTSPSITMPTKIHISKGDTDRNLDSSLCSAGASFDLR